MRVLVTGGAGFIGCNFIRLLLAEEPACEVIALDKLTYAGTMRNLSSVSQLKNFTFIQGDICNPLAVALAMKGCDCVVNFAAETHVDRSITAPDTFLKTNVKGTYTLLEAARRFGVQRFLHISTDEVYGHARSPLGESRPSLETDAQRPMSPYAASKAAADNLAYSYGITYGLPVIITRCSNNYGPYQYPEKQLPLFILNALENRHLPVYGDGKNVRDWIHVSDHVAALLLLMRAERARVCGEIFNISASEERTILQNAYTILDLLGKPHDLLRFVADRQGHVPRHAVDASKLRLRCGWEPRISFEDGIKQTMQWYQEHTDWWTDVASTPRQPQEGKWSLRRAWFNLAGS